MDGLGLDSRYGSYADVVPAIALASVNMMSLFGLQRRLRGAITGHLAIYEMTSSRPNHLYARGFRRHGFGTDVTEYFDEHVEADAVHEQIAGRDLAGGSRRQNRNSSRISCSARRLPLPSTPVSRPTLWKRGKTAGPPYGRPSPLRHDRGVSARRGTGHGIHPAPALG